MAASATDRSGSIVLISGKHRGLYEQYYSCRHIQSSPNRWQQRVEDLAQMFSTDSVLDYGCGPAATLAAYSKLPIRNYDPCVPAYSSVPERADLVVCLHVLEHVEEHCLDYVLEHMRSLATKAVFIAVSTQDSTKTLPDGSPWHSFVKDEQWWRVKLCSLGFVEREPMDQRKEFVALQTIWD
jgi:hypothetical protein